MRGSLQGDGSAHLVVLIDGSEKSCHPAGSLEVYAHPGAEQELHAFPAAAARGKRHDGVPGVVVLIHLGAGTSSQCRMPRTLHNRKAGGHDTLILPSSKMQRSDAVPPLAAASWAAFRPASLQAATTKEDCRISCTSAASSAAPAPVRPGI